ncbi:hypothetical protein BH11PSE5_BH11PSE5_00780 [soil metagenome]
MILRRMDRPRFRRWLGYNYLPLNGAAWLAIAAVLLVEMPIMVLFTWVEAETPLWWLLAITGFGIIMTYWAFAHWHSD